MSRTEALLIVAGILATVSLGGCGNDESTSPGGGLPDLEMFPPQTYHDDFDSGTAGRRWGCDSSVCSWEVTGAGPLAPAVTPVGGEPGAANFVFQSPDPEGLDPNRGLRCENFSAEFTEEGTFAFNYFINTAGSIGFQDANRLSVSVWSHTVEYDADLQEDLIIASERTVVLEESGQTSSRFFMVLPAGHYDFEFCYERNRNVDIGPDFVQIDDVETCVGTSCMGEIPPVPRCRPDEGQTLVSDLNAVPRNAISIKRVQGTSNRYYVIIDTVFLDFISGGTASANPAFRDEVDGILNTAYVDGTTCEVDARTSLLIEMTTAEIIDFVLATGIITDALDELEQAIYDQAGNAFINNIIQGIQEKIINWALTMVARLIF